MAGKPNNYQTLDAPDRGDAFVLQHLALVKRTALYLRARVPAYIELNDMIQLGMLGLLDARKNFDPAMGIGFESFARIRIRGAIIDEARRLSKITRLAIRNKKSHEAALHALSGTLGREPTSREIAEHLGLSVAEYEHQRTHASSFNFQELEALMENDGFDIEAEQNDILDGMIDDETRSRLAHEISKLDERKRQIISLYYVEQMNLKEIGAIIGVNESRVCQILKAIVADLRSKLMKP